jgi:hypothetical protein
MAAARVQEPDRTLDVLPHILGGVVQGDLHVDLGGVVVDDLRLLFFQ